MFWGVSLFYLFSTISCKENIKTNFWIADFEFFRVFCFWWIIYFSPFILVYEKLILGIRWGCFLIFSYFSGILLAYWKDLSSLRFGFIVVFVILSKLLDLCMIHQDLDLPMTLAIEYDWKQTCSFSINPLSLIDIYKKLLKKFFNNFNCIATSHDFSVITPWMHQTLLFFASMKLVFTVGWFFHTSYLSSNFLKVLFYW